MRTYPNFEKSEFEPYYCRLNKTRKNVHSMRYSHTALNCRISKYQHFRTKQWLYLYSAASYSLGPYTETIYLYFEPFFAKEIMMNDSGD